MRNLNLEYLYLYGHLPPNFITNKEAEALGWEGGSLEPYVPGCASAAAVSAIMRDFCRRKRDGPIREESGCTLRLSDGLAGGDKDCGPEPGTAEKTSGKVCNFIPAGACPGGTGMQESLPERRIREITAFSSGRNLWTKTPYFLTGYVGLSFTCCRPSWSIS